MNIPVIGGDSNALTAKWCIHETEFWRQRATYGGAMAVLRQIESGEIEAPQDAIHKLEHIAAYALAYCEVRVGLT